MAPCGDRTGSPYEILHLRGFDLKVRFDGFIGRLFDAGVWLALRGGGWLKLSWAHLNSGGRLACWFKKVAGWLRCFVWSPTSSNSSGVDGFMVRNLQEVAVKPLHIIPMKYRWLGTSRKLL